MTNIPDIYIGENFFKLDEILNSYKDKECGAVDIFIGMPRASEEDGDIIELFYESYKSMAEKIIKEIIEDAKEKFKLKKVIVHHRIGSVPLSEPSFLVVVWSGHREEAFKGCRYVVDEVKAKAPIWKKEIFKDGNERWKENKG